MDYNTSSVINNMNYRQILKDTSNKKELSVTLKKSKDKGKQAAANTKCSHNDDEDISSWNFIVSFPIWPFVAEYNSCSK